MLAKKKEKDVIDLMLDQIDFHGMTAEELSGESGLLKQLTARFYERALEAEMDGHLGYRKNDNAGDNSGNSRNGHTSKKVILEDNGTVEVQVPRDRNSTFEPVIIPKHEKRAPLFNSTAGDIVNGVVEVSFAGSVSQIQVPLYVQIIQNFCTSVLGGVAVPLFFVISSYLFFAKPKPVSKTIKSKLRSIVVPYIFWTVLTILLYFLAQSFSFSRAYFSKEENIIRSWHFWDFVKAFVGRNVSYLDYWHPIVYQFWYVRNFLIRAEGFIPRRLRRKKGMKSDCDTL